MKTPRQHVQYAQFLTNFLDNKFSIFGIKIGLDPFLDFIPFVGSFAGAAMSLYLLWIGWQMNVKSSILIQMLINIAVDYFIGIIPVVGFLGDIVFKANVRNLELLKSQLSDDVLEGVVIS